MLMRSSNTYCICGRMGWGGFMSMIIRRENVVNNMLKTVVLTFPDNDMFPGVGGTVLI